MTNQELFMLFMAVGFDNGLRRKVSASLSNAARFEYLTETQISLIKAVGLAEAESAEALIEEDSIYTISEEYAAGGLFLVAQAFATTKNFPDWMRAKLTEMSKANASGVENE